MAEWHIAITSDPTGLDISACSDRPSIIRGEAALRGETIISIETVNTFMTNEDEAERLNALFSAFPAEAMGPLHNLMLHFYELGLAHRG